MFREEFLFIKKAFKPKKFWNVTKLAAGYLVSRVFHRPFVWGYPPAVMIEPTNLCNLRCPLCPSGNGTLKREKGYLAFDLYRQIIDEIKDYAYMVILWNQGESFLHKDFLKMAHYASDVGLYTYVSTNGHFLTPPEPIVRSGIDTLLISVDGATQKTYQKYRIGGDLDKVFSDMDSLVEIKRKIGSRTPYTILQFIIMKHNQHEIQDIKILAKELRVDKLILKSAQIYCQEDIGAFLPRNSKFRRYRVEGTNFQLKAKLKKTCWTLWQQPVINCDGVVTPCCFDKDAFYPMGRMTKGNTLGTIWKDKPFQNFRAAILTKGRILPICKNCGEGLKLQIKQIELV